MVPMASFPLAAIMLSGRLPDSQYSLKAIYPPSPRLVGLIISHVSIRRVLVSFEILKKAS